MQDEAPNRVGFEVKFDKLSCLTHCFLSESELMKKRLFDPMKKLATPLELEIAEKAVDGELVEIQLKVS